MTSSFRINWLSFNFALYIHKRFREKVMSCKILLFPTTKKPVKLLERVILFKMHRTLSGITALLRHFFAISHSTTTVCVHLKVRFEKDKLRRRIPTLKILKRF